MAGEGDGSKQALVEEFNDWFGRYHKKAPISLLEASPNFDGCTLIFKLAGEHEFMLHCPPPYSDGDRCLAEAGPRLHSWAKAMNDFLLDTPQAPSLSDALSMALQLYFQEDSVESLSVMESSSASSIWSRTSVKPMVEDGDREAVCTISNDTVLTCDKLNLEFEEWNKETNDEMLFLLETNSNSDGAARLKFCLGGEHEFTLRCPQSYSSPEDRFTVEASPRLSSWSAAVNEVLVCSPDILQLRDVLSLAVECHVKDLSGQKEDSSSDEEMENEDESDTGIEMTDDDFFTTEWELELARKKKRWMQKEKQLREVIDKEESKKKLKDGESNKVQIFSTDASSGVLINDLTLIMEKGKDLGLFAEPVDDNIYCWSVKMSRFDHHSPLSEDLRVVHQVFGYKYIELQLHFTIDMYPFYPPQLKVMRPRLQPALMQRISSLDILKLSRWNPACNLISVLLEIKDFVQQFARLETHRGRNCPKRFPEGAYLPLDHHLLSFSLVSEVHPRANSQFVMKSQPNGTTANSVPSSKKKKEQTKEYWASGTGYGHGSDNRPVWDVAAYQAAQKHKDMQIEAVLVKIMADLQSDSRCMNRTDTSMSTPDSEIVESGSKEVLNSVDGTPEELYQVLEGSALIPFLESQLKVDSVLEVGHHVVLYKAIVGLIREIARHTVLVRLLAALPRQKQSIHRLLEGVKQQATMLLDLFDKASAASKSDADSKFKEMQLAKEFCSIYEEVTRALENQGLLGYEDTNKSNLEDKLNASNLRSEEAIYCRFLKPLQMKSFSFKDGSHGKVTHTFDSQKNATVSPTQVMRIAQELSSLAGSLPLSLSSSVFVRMDDDRCTVLKVLITGPEGTPYSGGCFMFDVYFPPRYPTEPPRVLLTTTGKNTVRFNPNLYACGKVCLSLLGTWQGQQGEKWSELTSTLLQVLISIQSLILVPDPYFNEPGYEQWINTAAGKSKSKDYNKDIFMNTMYWAMVEQLKNPSPGFEEVIRTHFALRKNSLLKELQDRMAEYNCSSQADIFKHLQQQLKSLPEVKEPA